MLVHDYREDKTADGATLVVRKHCRYGQAKAGERVKIDRAELQSATTMAALETENDVDAREAQDAAQRALQALPRRNSIKAMVEAGMNRLYAPKPAAEDDEHPQE
jgi:hypothetical protein